jgi:glycosyltransferase involved in cell wall biosynthesis
VKRTILFASTYWGSHAPGGAEWTNAAWAHALARRGHRVAVVTPNYGDVVREEDNGILVVRPPFPFGAFHHEAGRQREAPWLLHRNPLFHAWFARHVRRVARAEGAEILHAQNNGAVVAASRAARALGRPFVVTIRDVGLLCPVGMCPVFERRPTYDCSARDYLERCVPSFLEHYAAGDGVVRRAQRRLSLRLAWRDHATQRRALAAADLVLGVSRGILSVFPRRLVDAGRARVVHSPLPHVDGTIEPPDRVRQRLGVGAGPLVLYAGKRSPGKGTEVLVAALDAIRAGAPGVRFVFAGKGELAPPVGADVHVLGSVPQPTLFALYGAADVVVVPSVWPEPLSRVLIEAMHFGRAVVATRVGGSPELVEDDVTGLLVEPGDHAALARAVVTLLRDAGRRARVGAAAAKHVAAELDEDRLVGALLDAYESVLGRRAEAPPRPA